MLLRFCARSSEPGRGELTREASDAEADRRGRLQSRSPRPASRAPIRCADLRRRYEAVPAPTYERRRPIAARAFTAHRMPAASRAGVRASRSVSLAISEDFAYHARAVAAREPRRLTTSATRSRCAERLRAPASTGRSWKRRRAGRSALRFFLDSPSGPGVYTTRLHAGGRQCTHSPTKGRRTRSGVVGCQ